MKKLTKKLSALALCTAFASMQIAVSAAQTVLPGAEIGSTQGGFAGITGQTGDSATLNFNGSSIVNWNSLNVGNGETLNFNALPGVNGITVLNSVSGGMSQIYGTINSNNGIAKLIISNPNGVLFDGAKFTTAGDLMITTQGMGGVINGNGDLILVPEQTETTSGVTIKNSDFSVGGTFNITAPSVEAIKTAIKADNGFKLITADGRDFLVAPTSSNNVNHEAVRLESVSIDGDVYIASGKDLVKIVNGGEIKGNLKVESDGNVALNYVNDGKQLHVTGNVDVDNDGRISYLRKAKVDGNVNMSNSGGFLEVADIDVAGDVNLKTTVKSNAAVKHFVHVIGDSKVGGNLNIDSIHNIHIGGYDNQLQNFKPGSLTVGGDINALARKGSVTTTINTTADKVNYESGTLNILTDGKAVIKANEYKFKANRYIGGVTDKDELISVMENYKPLPNITQKAFVNIDGGNVTKIETSDNGYAFIRSNNDMNVTGVNANRVNLSSDQHDIVIGSDVHADLIVVDGETKNLTVDLPSRDYTLKYTDIKDTQVITINPDTTITYDMANGENGWNKGTQTADNTYLVVPGPGPGPIPPTPDPDPVNPNTQDNDNVKILNNLLPDQVATAIDAQQALTPIAFAADLEDEEEMPVRKNVDGSVTVVKPFTPID